MTLKEFILKLYNFPFLSKEQTDLNQRTIRAAEWDAVKQYIKTGRFLDVGCGAGFSMKKAIELSCNAYGIDPNPGEHGVGRYNAKEQDLNIIKGVSESLPYENLFFDTVYSSHVLEHVNSVDQTLSEMKRVLKDDGVLIIGMPTDTMAKINLFTQYFFTSHHRIVNAFLKKIIKTGACTFKEIFLPPSHSHKGKSIYFDISYYRPSNWKKLLEEHFDIKGTILPLVYPYPETIQYFKPYKSSKKGSSVFFVCKKKY
ncbi:MAG: class I SAM-dependent methyltransferase [Bacteroidota bacterium]